MRSLVLDSVFVPVSFLLTHRQISNCLMVHFLFWSSGTPKALCCEGEQCLQQWTVRAGHPLCTVSPCWLCVCLDGAPDLTSLPQLMAPDQHRGWKRGFLAMLELKFYNGDEPGEAVMSTTSLVLCDSEQSEDGVQRSLHFIIISI